MAQIEPAALELLREKSGLSIDAEGRFLHCGQEITHVRTLEVLWRSLERCPDGRYLVRIGRESGYVRVEDAPYVVRAVVLEGETRLSLNDGTTERLRPESLSLDREGVIHCVVKGGHRARFSRSAQIALGLEAEEDPVTPGEFSVRIAGRRWPIRPT